MSVKVLRHQLQDEEIEKHKILSMVVEVAVEEVGEVLTVTVEMININKVVETTCTTMAVVVTSIGMMVEMPEAETEIDAISAVEV